MDKFFDFMEKHFFKVVVIWTIICSAVAVGVILVASHFIAKYW